MSATREGSVQVCVVTLFPEFFVAPVSCTVLARALGSGEVALHTINPRDDATDRHATVDDTPYGGGVGMVLRATELAAATARARAAVPNVPVVMLTPQGRPFDQKLARRYAEGGGVILICGRYEGVDERYIERYVDEEISVGDFVMTGGEPAALCIADAVFRLVPGVLGNERSTDDESFSAERLEYPQFTRPARFEGIDVPGVLTSGDHGRVARWRKKVGLLRTLTRRPDLLTRRPLDRDELSVLADTSLDVADWLVRARRCDGDS